MGIALFSIAPQFARAERGFSVSAEIVTQAPPPPRHETIGERPSPEHLWVPGYWRWEGGHHVWVGGRWEMPPRAHAVYVAPRWVSRDNGYVLVDGGWHDEEQAPPTQPPAAPPGQVVVSQPPPAPPAEVISQRPSPDQVWVPGYWVWQSNAYAWVGGHWETPPTLGAVFVPAQWEARDGGYAFTPGQWQTGSAASTPTSEIVVTTPPPPPPREEIIIRRPSRSHIWVSGYWAWQDRRYIWIPGHWELPPRRHAVYVEPRWERRGGTYVFINGFWR